MKNVTVDRVRPQRKRERSSFAEMLRRMLDDTERFDRAEWAGVLEVSTPAISQWVNDRTLPRPESLRLIVSVLRPVAGEPGPVLSDFLKLADQPAEEVTPLANRLGDDPSFAHFMVRPLRENFLQLLATLPPPLQEAVLFESAEQCHAFWQTGQIPGRVSSEAAVMTLSEKSAEATQESGPAPLPEVEPELQQVATSGPMNVDGPKPTVRSLPPSPAPRPRPLPRAWQRCAKQWTQSHAASRLLTTSAIR